LPPLAAKHLEIAAMCIATLPVLAAPVSSCRGVQVRVVAHDSHAYAGRDRGHRPWRAASTAGSRIYPARWFRIRGGPALEKAAGRAVLPACQADTCIEPNSRCAPEIDSRRDNRRRAISPNWLLSFRAMCRVLSSRDLPRAYSEAHCACNARVVGKPRPFQSLKLDDSSLILSPKSTWNGHEVFGCFENLANDAIAGCSIYMF
jgi:hypothetical protein